MQCADVKKCWIYVCTMLSYIMLELYHKTEVWDQQMVVKPRSYDIMYSHDIATWTLCIQLMYNGGEISISLIQFTWFHPGLSIA